MTRYRTASLALCLALNACGDDDAATGGMDDATLCSEERDHDEAFCGPDEERIDSTRALALLRERYPGARIYSMEGSSDSALNVDGEDSSWSFLLTDLDGTWFTAGVRANGDVDGEELDDARCDGAPFEPLDSRRAVHQAVAAFDAKVGFFAHGYLRLGQNVCGHEPLPEAHYVRLSPRADDAGRSDRYFARFRHDQSFIDLVGPCPWPSSLDDCLAGVVVEPEE